MYIWQFSLNFTFLTRWSNHWISVLLQNFIKFIISNDAGIRNKIFNKLNYLILAFFIPSNTTHTHAFTVHNRFAHEERKATTTKNGNFMSENALGTGKFILKTELHALVKNLLCTLIMKMMLFLFSVTNGMKKKLFKCLTIVFLCLAGKSKVTDRKEHFQANEKW